MVCSWVVLLSGTGAIKAEFVLTQKVCLAALFYFSEALCIVSPFIFLLALHKRKQVTSFYE